jgi:hypothetical protein
VNNKLLLAKDDTEHMLLHEATLLGIIQMLEKLWEWSKEQLTTEKLNNIDRQIYWHLTIVKSKLEALGKLWECANEELMLQEPSNQFLFTKDD